MPLEPRALGQNVEMLMPEQLSASPQLSQRQLYPQHTCSPEPQIGSARVLLVEDDAAVRTAACMLLKVEGYRVTTVGSLAEALLHAREGNGIDLLVTDYHLSNGELGSQVIAALRESPALPVKAVLMTGDTSTAVAEWWIAPRPRDPSSNSPERTTKWTRLRVPTSNCSVCSEATRFGMSDRPDALSLMARKERSRIAKH